MDIEILVDNIIKFVGYENNINQHWHCITRLRFNLKDNDAANLDELKKLKGVLGVQFQSGQLQIVIGPSVGDVYKILQKKLDGKVSQIEQNVKAKKENIFSQVIDVISGIFTPFLPAIVGGGVLKGFIALFQALGLINPQTGTFSIFSLIADAPFYFLPFFIAITASRKFKLNEFIGLTLAAAYLYPTLTHPENGITSIKFIGLIDIPIVSYSSSVFPIILGIWLMSYIYKYVDKFVPKLFKIIITPMVVMSITIPISLWLIGPLGIYSGVYLEKGISWLVINTGWLYGVLLCGFLPLIVMSGMHYGLFPSTFSSLKNSGYDMLLLPMSLISNMSMAGATLAVGLRHKDPDVKSLAFSTGASAIFGITEPAIYGITLRFKKPFIAAMIGGAVGGGYAAFTEIKMFGFAIPGITALPLYINESFPENFYNILIAIAIGFFTSFFVSFILMSNDSEIFSFKKEDADNVVNDNKQNNQFLNEQNPIKIVSPITGNIIIDSKNFPDVLSNKYLGKTIILSPEDGGFYSPFDGEISLVSEEKHTLGLVSNSGVELLISIKNEKELGIPCFERLVENGMKIKEGQKIFNINEGLFKSPQNSLEISLTITNANKYFDVLSSEINLVKASQDTLFFIFK